MASQRMLSQGTGIEIIGMWRLERKVDKQRPDRTEEVDLMIPGVKMGAPLAPILNQDLLQLSTYSGV